jgi:hypothetical protein
MKASFRKLVQLGFLVISTSTLVVTSDDFQVVIDGPQMEAPHKWWLPTFDTVEDVVEQWAENGREFMNRNGQTCTYLLCKVRRLKGF